MLRQFANNLGGGGGGGGGGVTAKGQATLSSGLVTVTTPVVSATSVIQLDHGAVSGEQGLLSVGTITLNTSFQIVSTSSTDNSLINWTIQ